MTVTRDKDGKTRTSRSWRTERNEAETIDFVLDDGARIVITTHQELSVLGRWDGAPLGDTLPVGAAAYAPISLVRHGEHVAVAFVIGDGTNRRIGLRCATLPPAMR